MDRQAFLALTTSSQWILFVGIGLIIYSWIERKRLFLQLGQGAYLLLALFALWVIFTDQIVVPQPVEKSAVPVEAKALTYFTGLLITGGMSILAFILGLMKKTAWEKVVNMILVAVGLALFFMVYQLQRI